MLKRGMFGSVLTVTVKVVEELTLRKFVKLSVIVYDALVRYFANIVIGVVTWYRELKLFK